MQDAEDVFRFMGRVKLYEGSGRLKFDDQPNPAPFPSAVAIFK